MVAYVAYLDHVCFHEASPNVDVGEKIFDDISLKQLSICDLIKVPLYFLCEELNLSFDQKIVIFIVFGYALHSRPMRSNTTRYLFCVQLK